MSTQVTSIRTEGLIRILEKERFAFLRQHGDHRALKNRLTDKIITVPMHSRELPRWLVEKIAKDAGIIPYQLRGLLEQ